MQSLDLNTKDGAIPSHADRVSRAVALMLLIGGWALMALKPAAAGEQGPPRLAEVVALDECDPATFNAALGPGICLNVTPFGSAVTLSDLLASIAAGTPNPNWDFEPDSLTIKSGTILEVVNQGGEPHTFTEVAKFGGGFVPPANPPGESVVPECAGGFSDVKVASTRILQGSHLNITGLSKGTHLFQCCIHPWMHFQVTVK
jgi:plastocyanin